MLDLKDVSVYVIVVTYNGSQWYQKCFDSLKKSVIPLNVVVVDNASSDNTVDFVKGYYPDFKLIESDENLGFGKANNLGIKYALDHGADYVFLLNQDAWIEPNVVSDLIKISRSHTHYGILSPIHLNSSMNRIEKDALTYISERNSISKEFFNDLFFNKLKLVYDIRFINAAAWLIPRDVLLKVGGFDPIYFHYGEDDHYVNRILYHGYKVGICPSLKIIHDTENRLTDVPKKAKQNIYKSLLVRCTNININTTPNEIITSYVKRVLLDILSFSFYNCRQNISIIKFIMKHKNQINNSNAINKKIGAHWL